MELISSLLFQLSFHFTTQFFFRKQKQIKTPTKTKQNNTKNNNKSTYLTSED